MKKILLLIFLNYSFLLTAQVSNEGTPASWGLNKKSSINAIFLPEIDIKKIRAEDDINDKLSVKPYRVGVSHHIDVGLENAGAWTELSNGDRIWNILFSAKEAVHLSVNFDKFYLPKGATMYLYNEDKTDLLGAYTEVQNNRKQVLGTGFVKGDKLYIEYYEPKEVIGIGRLNITAVIHGYRLGSTFQKGYYDETNKALNDSGDCNYDVDCDIGADFEAKKDLLKKSVALLNLGNGFICTGGLVNNTAQDKKPYFLTANHCFFDNDNNPSDPALYSMRFNWISPNPVCAEEINSTNGPTNFNISGSELRSRNEASDFMLLEINNMIPDDWDVNYAGWDRSDTDPTFEIGIHHPNGDIMKICRDNTGATKATTESTQVWLIGGVNDGIGVGNGWEIGITEGGSSGSHLFDQNGRIIGQLFGGQAECIGTSDNDDFDLYGRFAVSWDNGSTSASRLKEWLDPAGTNPIFFNGSENITPITEFIEENIVLYPNPSSSGNVKILGFVQGLKYDIYNTLGQILKSGILESDQISFENFSNHVYFVRLTEIESNISVIKKIILRK